ncbi:hypothetical protein AC58_4544 [Escherichia coli 3-105-05_S3_C3]|nr:hypothetical protein AC58_5232 [Escherichia coli 3-105-05_S3_C3]KDU06746.1 hypothetical protein AC58_4544 [Escherichia coli 3-105-05_S3_C3]
MVCSSSTIDQIGNQAMPYPLSAIFFNNSLIEEINIVRPVIEPPWVSWRVFYL